MSAFPLLPREKRGGGVRQSRDGPLLAYRDQTNRIETGTIGSRILIWISFCISGVFPTGTNMMNELGREEKDEDRKYFLTRNCTEEK